MSPSGVFNDRCGGGRESAGRWAIAASWRQCRLQATVDAADARPCAAHGAHVAGADRHGGSEPRAGRCGGHRADVRAASAVTSRRRAHWPKASVAGAGGGVKTARLNRTFLVSASGSHGASTAMPPLRQHASDRPPAVRVERIATEPMSRRQREQAVMALAALITAWQHSVAGGRAQHPASRLPLYGAASDTDHAAGHARDHRARTREPRHDTRTEPTSEDGRPRR